MTKADTVVAEYVAQIAAGGTPNLVPQFGDRVLEQLTPAQRAAYRARLGLPPERPADD